MKKECDGFPRLSHKDCELKPDEKIVAEYFESRSLIVERLCAVKSERNEKTPDFRFTDAENIVYICEVKKPESSMGNLTKTDEEYLDRAEFEKLVEEAKKQNIFAVVTEEQWNFYHDRTPYPNDERNTDLKEKENAKKLKKWLKESPIGKSLVAVKISRNDSFNWTEEELRNFSIYLIDSLRIIENDQVPPYWNKDFHTINGYYRKARKNGRYIQNQIQVISTGERFSIDVQFSMGINWGAIEGDSRQAQKQIKDRLKRHESGEVVRLIVIFLEQNLLFEYFPEIDKLETEVNRRLLSKFPELSAIIFCENFDSRFSHANFLVFHNTNNNIPSLPRNIFDDGYSFQFPK